MKLATFKTAQGISYGAVTAKGIVDLRRYLGNQYPDLKALIEGDALDQAKKHLSETPDYKASDISWLPTAFSTPSSTGMEKRPPSSSVSRPMVRVRPEIRPRASTP